MEQLFSKFKNRNSNDIDLNITTLKYSYLTQNDATYYDVILRETPLDTLRNSNQELKQLNPSAAGYGVRDITPDTLSILIAKFELN